MRTVLLSKPTRWLKRSRYRNYSKLLTIGSSAWKGCIPWRSRKSHHNIHHLYPWCSMLQHCLSYHQDRKVLGYKAWQQPTIIIYWRCGDLWRSRGLLESINFAMMPNQRLVSFHRLKPFPVLQMQTTASHSGQGKGRRNW